MNCKQELHLIKLNSDRCSNTTFNTGPAPIVGTRFRDDEHTVKVGVNYRFGWGGPVAARY